MLRLASVLCTTFPLFLPNNPNPDSPAFKCSNVPPACKELESIVDQVVQRAVT